jgi:hypothetical protein
LQRNIPVSIVLFMFCLVTSAGLSAQPYFDAASLHYINSPAKKLNGSKNNPSAINYISAQAGLPFKMDKDILLFNPFFEQYDLLIKPETGTTQLKSVGLPISFLKQWKNEAWKTAFVFIPRINAGLEAIDKNDYQFGGAILMIYKKKENLKYKFGAYYNSEFFGPFFIPLLGIDWNVNDHLNLFGVLPGNLALEYKISSIFYGGINFKSITNSYRFDRLSYLKVSDNYLKLFLDCYLVKKFVITLEAGHSVLRKYKTGNPNQPFVQQNYGNGLLFKAGLSYRIRLDEKK